MTFPTVLTIASTALFLVLERVIPGRALPLSLGWYARALSINFVQLAMTLWAGRIWPYVFSDLELFQLRKVESPALEGFVAWFIGTFVFYWWHRLRHQNGFWAIFHQIHHSPSRIEVVTSFYKHPIEIFSNTAISAFLLYSVLGCSILGAFWYNFFAATGEYFYHANVRTPRWLRFFIQTPELHSIHHQYGVHWFNFGDIPLWDRLFGTYCDASLFVSRCGFSEGAEQRIGGMLFFQNVCREDTP